MKKTASRPPVNVAGIFTGGGRYGYLSIRTAQSIEEESGHKLAELFQGGFIGNSVGTIPAASAAFEMMTMDNLAKTFIRELPQFMPCDDWFHIKQGAVDIQNSLREAFIKATRMERVSETLLNVGIASESSWNFAALKAGIITRDYVEKDIVASLYDREHMNKVIHKWFGSVNLSDSPNPLFMTSQKTGPDCREPYDFYFIDKNIVKPNSDLSKPNPTLNVSVSDAILAATAMPTAFQAHKIKETGTSHTDQAQVDTGTAQLVSLQKSLKNEFEMGLVQFDTFLGNSPIRARHHNGKGWLRMTFDQDLTNNHAIQAQLNAERIHRVMLGEENCHILRLTRDDVKASPFNDNMLDTTPDEIKNMINGMDEYIDRNRSSIILPVVDFLVENLAAHEAHAMEQRMPVAPIVKEDSKPEEEDSSTGRFKNNGITGLLKRAPAQ